MSILHFRKANTGAMFYPLKEMTNHQKLGLECYLVGHTVALSAKMPKSHLFICKHYANSSRRT